MVATLFLGLSSVGRTQWSQLGTEHFGDAGNDNFGNTVSINGSGNIYASSTRGSTSITSYCKVFKWDLGTSSWEQMGSDLTGATVGDYFGLDQQLSEDGNRIVVGAFGSGEMGSYSGHTKVFEWDGADWVQMGSTILGDATLHFFGYCVSMNNTGDRIASFSANSNYCRIFEWDGTDWVQLGSDILHEGGTTNGSEIALNGDGSRVVVGSNGGITSGTGSGYSSVYEWDGTDWVQMGSNIEALDNESEVASSVEINDSGNRIVLNARYNDGGGTDYGRVRTYEWDGSSWNQMGGTFQSSPDDYASYGVGVSFNGAGNRLAIGDPDNLSGIARVYEWDGSSWLQVDSDIMGDGFSNYFSYDVRLNSSGKVLLVGDYVNYSTVYGAGASWVFSQPLIDSEVPSLTADFSTICEGDSAEISISGELNDGDGWAIYDDACEGTLLLYTENPSFKVGPSTTTTYYVQATGPWFPASACESIEITINSVELGISQSGANLMADATGAGIGYQWIDCSDNSVISGETNQIFTPENNGDYAVIIDDNGCVDTSGCMAINDVGIGDQLSLQTVVFPNPSNGIFTVVSTEEKITRLEVYNGLGKRVHSVEAIDSNKQQLDLGEFKNGNYLLVITTQNSIFRKTIIKY